MTDKEKIAAALRMIGMGVLALADAVNERPSLHKAMKEQEEVNAIRNGKGVAQ